MQSRCTAQKEALMVKGKGTGREAIMKSSTKGVTKSQDSGYRSQC